MTVYELRRHLADTHDMHTSGADYGTLLALHDHEHQARTDHDHDDQPGTAQWQRECIEFGCNDG